jgi:hypothetical protein
MKISNQPPFSIFTAMSFPPVRGSIVLYQKLIAFRSPSNSKATGNRP